MRVLQRWYVPSLLFLSTFQSLQYNSMDSRHTESCKQHLFVDQPVVLTWGKQIPVVGS